MPEQAAWSATVNANLPWQQHAAHTAGSSSKAGAPAGSVKLRLEISTNIPPGFGAAIDWDNPLLPSNGLVLNGPASSNQDPHGDQQFGPEWEEQQQQQGTQGFEPAAGSGRAMRWRGGGAVALISALQKSVRRGCAASATRCAPFSATAFVSASLQQCARACYQSSCHDLAQLCILCLTQ